MIITTTDGGPHSAETWAGITAANILDISRTAPDLKYDEAMTFREDVVKILTGHHQLNQDQERAGLSTEGTDRLTNPIDPSSRVPDAVDDIIAAAKGKSFAAHFANPEVRAYLERLMHEHFHAAAWIERSWHADANLDHPISKAFRAVSDQGHALLPMADEDLAHLGGRDLVVKVMEANHLSAIPPVPASTTDAHEI